MRFASGTRMHRRVIPVGYHVRNFVGGVCFARCRTIRGKSALTLVRSTRFHFELIRTRTSCRGTLSKGDMIASSVRAVRGGVSISSTNVRRTGMHVSGTRHRCGHCRGLLRQSTIAHRRCSTIGAGCSTSGTHCRLLFHRGGSATLIGWRRARHLRRARTKVGLTRTTLRVTQLGLSCAIVVTPYSKAAKQGRVQRNILIRPKRALIGLISSRSG